MTIEYKIQFDWPSAVIYLVGGDIDAAGSLPIKDIPVSEELKIQLRGISDMFDDCMSDVIFDKGYPNAEQAIVFRKIYDRVIPKLKSELPSDWNLISEEYPGIFKN